MNMRIDINSDLGEGAGNDALLMPLISSANIACGYYAGDEDTMHRTVEMAMRNNVSIGAHPGYKDRENFGRVNMNISMEDTELLVEQQVYSLSEIVREHGGSLKHVKPHGALYNQAAVDMQIARAISRAVYKVDAKLILLGLANSFMLKAAGEVGLKFAEEVFADRAYTDQGTLVPRGEDGAVIHDTQLSMERVLRMIRAGEVPSINGSLVQIHADSVCIHGDHPQAVETARELRQFLLDNGVEIQSISKNMNHD